ncbi:arabinan endo-1,5-alpha-L-arabinosidase [Domibacillus indicus]|uniref:arabinan endo-1,5-alpha-L-arabinosidase n=1 Tax=Domibacillus indicus TaxID=1437523 RepID=UPI000617F237|nr:arabinan endo-1,5-alpha-L-arabinosidase [Domibacillus indicus]
MNANLLDIQYERMNESTVNNEKEWGTLHVHDPAILKYGDTYYVFSTDAKVNGEPRGGVQIRKSKDMIKWEWVGYAFDAIPEEAYQWTGAKGLWAPEVIQNGDEFLMYYSASQFGKNQSFIGLARAKHPEGPWTDYGEVVKTTHTDEQNAIDANIVWDEKKQPWLVYGSFFGGIRVFPIDPLTGKKKEGAEETVIARRHKSVEGAIEGPYIVYHPGFKKYYLFVSYDSLFSTYHIRVGRSDFVTGPYYDRDGNSLTDTSLPPHEVGLKVLGGYRFGESLGWIAPGHNSILKEDNDYFICHHARDEKNPTWHSLHIRKVVWSSDGWPLVSPERYSGEIEKPIIPDSLDGTWDIIEMTKDDNKQIKSKPYGLKGLDFLQLDGSRFLISAGRDKIEAVVLEAWDFEYRIPTYVFTGINQDGIVIVGKKDSR